MSKSWLIFCGLFAIVGIVCSGIGYRIWNKNCNLKTNGFETTALVIGHYKKKQISYSTAQAVIIQYTDQLDNTKVYYSTTYTTPVMFQVGENIKIWCKKNSDEVLMEGKDEWIIPMVLFGFGFIFSLIGLPSILRYLFSLIVK